METPNNPRVDATRTESEVARAFADRTVFSASDEELQKYLEALCYIRIDNEGVRDRVLIQGTTLTHLLLSNSIRRVNRRNTWFAIIVGTIAFLSFAASIIQILVESTSKMAKPLSDFSAAISEATTVTTSALSIVQAVDQDYAVLRASRGTSLKEKDIPGFLHPNDLLQRQLALETLSTYAVSLKTLSDADRSADIHKSFDALKTSIDSTVATINKLNTQSTRQVSNDLASDLISLSSNLAIAYNRGGRDKAIRTALEEKDKTVTRICDLLANEFGHHGVIYDQLENDYRAQEEAASERFQEVVDAAKTPKPSDLTPHVRTFVGLMNKKEYLLALLESLASSYQKIAQAHTALKVQSENGAKSDVQLKALSSEINKLKFLSSQVSK
jgi:hypothetical protein